MHGSPGQQQLSGACFRARLTRGNVNLVQTGVKARIRTALACQAGPTTLYQLQAIEDLHSWLLEHGDRVPLGTEAGPTA
jgi:hypothetical protein